MQYKQREPKPLKRFFKTIVFLVTVLPFGVDAQTTYLPQGARENLLLERMEIKAGTDSVLNFSKTKPYSRKQFIPIIEAYWKRSTLLQRTLETAPGQDSTPDQTMLTAKIDLTNVDLYNAQLALMSNPEWNTQTFTSRKPFLKSFYKSPAVLFEVNQKDFRLIVTPVFQYIVGKEKGSSEHLFLNTRGVTLRGNIANKIGFAAYITDNQERDPKYVQQWVLLPEIY